MDTASSAPSRRAARREPSLALPRLLEWVRDPDHLLGSLELHTLSDLRSDQLAQVQEVWRQLDGQRRRDFVSALLDFAEDQVDVNFTALYRWLMEDADAWVRAQAIEGLWEENDVRLISPLLRRLAEDEDLDVRAAAALSLGRYVLMGEFDQIDASAGKRVEQALLDAYEEDDDVWVRRRALESLAYSSNDALPDMILEAYEDDDDILRIGAIFAMGRSADPRWNSLVLDELGSNDNAVLFEAARASGELEIEEAVPDLIKLLADEDVELRDTAIWALGRIGGREARRALKACCSSPDEDLQEAAQDALAELDFMAGDDPMPKFFVSD